MAASLAIANHISLSDNARLFALMNLALSDATVAGWDSKLHFMSWRPITAIHLADGLNPDTVADPNWVPLLVTPRHPEYVSAHLIFSSAAAGVLAAYFGDDTTFSLESVGLRVCSGPTTASLPRSTRSRWPEFTPAFISARPVKMAGSWGQRSPSTWWSM